MLKLVCTGYKVFNSAWLVVGESWGKGNSKRGSEWRYALSTWVFDRDSHIANLSTLSKTNAANLRPWNRGALSPVHSAKYDGVAARSLRFGLL